MILVLGVYLKCPTYTMVSTYFSCNLSAVTNGACVNIILNYNDGNSFNYSFIDTYQILPKYYLYTSFYNITAMITNPSLNLGVYNNINGKCFET